MARQKPIAFGHFKLVSVFSLIVTLGHVDHAAGAGDKWLNSSTPCPTTLTTSPDGVNRTTFVVASSFTSLTDPKCNHHGCDFIEAACRDVAILEILADNVDLNMDFTSYFPSLTSVYFRGSVIEVGSKSFEDSPNLRILEFDSSVLRISSSAFKKCTRLQSVIFRSDVSEISTNAFENTGGKADGEMTVEFHGDVGDIKSSVFEKSNVETVAFYGNVTLIDNA